MTYTFDGAGERVKDSSPRLYWYGVDYYFGNVLGSAAITTATGSLCYDADFYPFGGELTFTNTCAQNYKFAGMERDSASGLDRTMFRQYSSDYGRWLSPDPYKGSYDVNNPQSMNRYSYVMNNPTSFVDPLGLDMQCGAEGEQYCPWENYGDSFSETYSNGVDYEVVGVSGADWWDYYSPENPGTPPDLGYDPYEYRMQVGMGGSSNGPSYTHADVCAASALLNNGAALALDAVSLGADAFGPEAQYAKLAVGLTLSTGSMINSAVHQDLTGTTLGMASYLKAPTELAARSAGWAWAKWIPFAGYVADAYSAINDVRQTMSDYSSCMAGH